MNVCARDVCVERYHMCSFLDACVLNLDCHLQETRCGIRFVFIFLEA